MHFPPEGGGGALFWADITLAARECEDSFFKNIGVRRRCPIIF